jgi:hypothetical protein
MNRFVCRVLLGLDSVQGFLELLLLDLAVSHLRRWNFDIW